MFVVVVLIRKRRLKGRTWTCPRGTVRRGWKMGTVKPGATGGGRFQRKGEGGRQARSAGKAPSRCGAASSPLSPSSEDASSRKPTLTALSEPVCSLPWVLAVLTLVKLSVALPDCAASLTGWGSGQGASVCVCVCLCMRTNIWEDLEIRKSAKENKATPLSPQGLALCPSP